MSNSPFHEYKVKSYEGGISAPFIAHWPQKIQKTGGKVYHTPASLIDIMPTILDAAGTRYPKFHPDGTKLFELEGLSLIPALVGLKKINHTYIYWEHSGFSAIRKGDWKAYKKVSEKEWELYNLATDRSEQVNVSGKYPDLVKELNDKWYQWATTHQVLPVK